MRPELSACILLFSGWQPALSADVPEPTDYRTSDYDASVPATLTGATRVSAAQVYQLMQEAGAVVIDVIPEHRKPDDLPDDLLWMPVEHRGIAGALWLPDIGFGALSEVTENYMVTQLQNVTNGDPDHPLVFYCRMDCWMSWNAARRALELGYGNVYWFANGIEDWLFEGFETEVLTPAEGQRQALK